MDATTERASAPRTRRRGALHRTTRRPTPSPRATPSDAPRATTEPARPRPRAGRGRPRAGATTTTSTSGTPARNRPTGAPDAVEFIDVHKAFGRNKILRGLNMGLPEDKISMILGPSGTGKSVCIKHMVGLLYPDEGDVLVHGESVPEHAPTTSCSRCARSSASCSRTARCSAR